MPTRRVELTGCCVVLRPHGCCGRRVRCSAGRAAWCAGGRRSFCVVCCPDRFPAAARPARSLAVRAASFARRVGSKPGQAAPPPTGTAAGLADLLLVAPLVFRAPDGPAAREARRPHFVRRRASKPARALRSLRHPPHRSGLSLCVARPFPPPPTGTTAGPPPSRRTRIQWSLPTFLSPPPISHAIPLRLFQTMNLQRWNCNVFRLY